MEPLHWNVELRKRRHNLAYLRFMLAQCCFCIVLWVTIFYNITVLKSRYAPALEYLFLAANFVDMYIRSTYNPSFLRSSYNVLEIVAFSNMFLMVTIVCFSEDSPQHPMFTGFQVFDMCLLIITFLRYFHRLSRGYKVYSEHARFSIDSLAIPTKGVPNQIFADEIKSAQMIRTENIQQN